METNTTQVASQNGSMKGETTPPPPEEKPNIVLAISLFVNRKVEAFFEKLTIRVVDNPKVVILAVVLLAVVLANGIWMFEEEQDESALFSPKDSRAVEEREVIDAIFEKDPRALQIYFVSELGDILTQNNLKLLALIDHHIQNVAAGMAEGMYLNYPTVCVRQFDACKPVGGILRFFENTTFPVHVAPPSDLAIKARINENWRDYSPSGPPLQFYLEGTVKDASGAILSAKITRLIYSFNNRPKIRKGEHPDELSAEFERVITEFVKSDYIQGMAAALMTTTATNSESETEDTGQEATQKDVNSLIIGYVLLIVYSQFVLSRGRLKYSHSMLGLASVVSVGLATISSYGFCWYCGIKFNRVVQVLILVLLGVGVDDTFVIMDSWWDHAHVKNMRTRMILSMKHAGPSITITSLTDVVAFAVGASTVLPALQTFCAYAVFGLFFDFAFQCTFFVAIAYLDSKRQDNNRADCCCCVTVNEESGWCGIKCRNNPDAKATEDNAPKKKPWKESTRPVFAQVIGTYLPRITLGSIPGKLAVLILSSILLGIGVWGCTEVKMNFNREWFIPDDADLAVALSLRDEYFTGQSAPLGFFTMGVADYPAFQKNLYLEYATASSVRWTSPLGQRSCFLHDLSAWVAQISPGNVTLDASYLIVEPRYFYHFLNLYLDPTSGPPSAGNHIDKLRFDNTDVATRKLIATKCVFSVGNGVFGNGQNAVDAMTEYREVLDAFEPINPPGSRVFVYAMYFVFWESFAVMMREMFRNVAIASCAVFVLVTILSGNLLLGSFVTLVIVCVDVCLLGFMPIVGVDINMVSVVCVVLAVGLAVDYSVHIANCFLQVSSGATDKYSSRTQRAAYALWKIGPSVMNGGLSTFLALIPLLIAKSYVFKVFFRMFAVIIGFGLWFGVITLPVLLSLFGPPPNLNAVRLETEPYHNPLSPDYDLLEPEEEHEELQ